MNDKVAAAVERINMAQRKLQGSRLCHPEAVKTLIDEASDELDAAIAELDRMAGGGDMLPDALMPVSKEWYTLCERRFAVDKITISGDLARAIVDAISTRPPVAGLAELTDAQLVELFDYIEVARGNAAQKHWASSETMQSWEARRKVVIAKAAREFLGKVDA